MSPATTPAANPGQWSIIKTEPTVGTDVTGKAARGYRVYYQLSTGQTGSVFVAEDSFSPDAVKAAVTADAQTLAAIYNLKPG